MPDESSARVPIFPIVAMILATIISAGVIGTFAIDPAALPGGQPSEGVDIAVELRIATDVGLLFVNGILAAGMWQLHGSLQRMEQMIDERIDN